jgi:hypothetical protein
MWAPNEGWPVMEELGNIFVSVLQHCQKRNMPLPYLFVAVAINGGILGARYLLDESGEGLEAEMLVEPTPGGMMQMPINVMIVDATGEAVRVLITPEGATFLT